MTQTFINEYTAIFLRELSLFGWSRQDEEERPSYELGPSTLQEEFPELSGRVKANELLDTVGFLDHFWKMRAYNSQNEFRSNRERSHSRLHISQGFALVEREIRSKLEEDAIYGNLAKDRFSLDI